MAKATFAAGCFWGVEATFRQLPGVISTRVGYTGGQTANPSYKDVCTDRTGHAEAVEVEYDPAKLSYDKLLEVFWENHDPTQLNRQGPDTGSQYRSEIFYSTPEQKRIAEAYIAQLEQAHAFARPIVTRVDSLPGFYPAEEYHQDFLVHNPTYPYIVFNDLPKIENLKRVLPDYYVGRPVLLSNVIAH